MTTCFIPNCDKEVIGPWAAGCVEHWNKLPKAFKDAIGAAMTDRHSDQYRSAVERAREYLHVKAEEPSPAERAAAHARRMTGEREDE